MKTKFLILFSLIIFNFQFVFSQDGRVHQSDYLDIDDNPSDLVDAIYGILVIVAVVWIINLLFKTFKK